MKGKPPPRPPRVRYSRTFEEIEAYTAMGLTATQYHALPGTPEWASRKSGGLSKCHVIQWYNFHEKLASLREGIF